MDPVCYVLLLTFLGPLILFSGGGFTHSLVLKFTILRDQVYKDHSNSYSVILSIPRSPPIPTSSLRSPTPPPTTSLPSSSKPETSGPKPETDTIAGEVRRKLQT